MLKFSTAQILVNIATVQYLLENFPESIKFYRHTLDILDKIISKNTADNVIEVFLERGKVLTSFGDLFRQLSEIDEAKQLYKKAIVSLQSANDEIKEIIQNQKDQTQKYSMLSDEKYQ